MPTIFEAKNNIEQIKKLTPFASVLLSLMISGMAFSYSTKKEMLERDNNASVESGKTQNLEAAHYNHDKRNEDYDSVDNGRMLTRAEHYMDHYTRHGRKDLGLTRRQNRWALNTIWRRMTKKERRGLPPPPRYESDEGIQRAFDF